MRQGTKSEYIEIDMKKLEIVASKQLYQRSFYHFYKDAFVQLHNGEYDDNWHAKYLCDVLQEKLFSVVRKERSTKDIIVNMPFRCSKSMLCTVMYPVWGWIIDPTLKFMNVSYSGDLALEHSRRSRDLIATKWFQRLFGNRVVLNPSVSALGLYANVSGGERRAVGIGGQITGSGCDIIIVDDPQNPQNAASDIERMNTIDKYDGTVYSRLNNNRGFRLIVQQRLHEMDLTGKLLHPKLGRPEDHIHICMPGELDLEVLKPLDLQKYYVDGLFWPSRMDRSTLNSYKKALGSLKYAGQVGQRPTPLEGGVWHRNWFHIIDASEVTRDPVKNPINFIVDTAYSEKTSNNNDPSGFLSYFERDNKMYITNYTEDWFDFPELIKFLQRYVNKNGYTEGSRIYIEPKASGISVLQQLKQETKLNVIKIEGDFIKDDKLTRASSVSAMIESGRVFLIRGAWNEHYLMQVSAFPRSLHDEAVDVTVYGLNYLSKRRILAALL